MPTFSWNVDVRLNLRTCLVPQKVQIEIIEYPGLFDYSLFEQPVTYNSSLEFYWSFSLMRTIGLIGLEAGNTTLARPNEIALV